MDKYSKLEFIQSFRKELKNRDYQSTITVAIKTAGILLKIIQSKDLYSNLEDLHKIIKLVGRMFISADMMQFSVGNIVKRILHFINQQRSKFIHKQTNKRNSILNLNNILSMRTFQQDELLLSSRDRPISKCLTTTNKNNQRFNFKIDDKDSEDLSAIGGSESQRENANSNLTKNDKILYEAAKEQIIEDINFLIEELEDSSSSIVKQASEHINDNDVILTANCSDQLHDFLVEAKKFKEFHVIIAESSPSLKGIEMAEKLSKSKIKTTLINDSAIFSIMPKISKVIIGTRSVMANGGLISYNGVYNICLAAQNYSIPVIVVSGIFKLTPMYPFDHETFNEQLSPDTIFNSKFKNNLSNITFNSPAYDYVPSELISIFVTDEGSYHPSFMYRLFNELYSTEQDDFNFS